MPTKEEVMKQANKALVKMCRMVGVDIADVDFKEENWFQKHAWTEKQQRDFIKWMTERLVKDRHFRKGLMAFPCTSFLSCRQTAEQFVFAYGWAIKKEDLDNG